MLVPGARRSSATAPGAGETKDRMVVRKRRYCGGPALSCPSANGGRLDETPSASAYARQRATLNQPPDGRPGNAQRSSRLFHRNHCFSHACIVSRSSHRLNRLISARASITTADHEADAGPLANRACGFPAPAPAAFSGTKLKPFRRIEGTSSAGSGRTCSPQHDRPTDLANFRRSRIVNSLIRRSQRRSSGSTGSPSSPWWFVCSVMIRGSRGQVQLGCGLFSMR